MKLFIAGHNGMVGGALVRRFQTEPGVTLVLRSRRELDLENQAAVNAFYAAEKPDVAIIAAAKVGGIHANNTYPADFIYANLIMAANCIHGAYAAGVQRLLFLGSSCIYPKHAPQPMAEDCLLTGPLEPTNEAYAIAKVEMGTEIERIRMLHKRLLDGIGKIDQVFINGDLERRVPHNVNASFSYVEGESLIMGVKGIAVSSGSACTSASLEPSYVLRALGRSDELAHSSLRMTIGRYTTEAEIDYAVNTLQDRVARLRELSPLWEMYKDGIDISTIQWSAH